MKTISLTCNHCGAPLEVPDGTNFVTCRFCSTRLAIEHSESAVYTRVLEAIQNQTVELSQDLDTIKLQNELERADREWQMERDQMMVRGKSGRLYEPSVGTAAFQGVFQIVIGLLWFGITMSVSSATGHAIFGFMSLVGLGISLFGIVVLLQGIQKARYHTYAKEKYELHRRSLIEELDDRIARS